MTLRATRKLALIVGTVATVVSLGAATALAADTGDSLSPTNTSFNVANSGNITFTGIKVFGSPVTTTCTDVTLTGKTRASGLTADVTTNPNFDNAGMDCTDSLGGTDTVTSSGTWTLTLVDAASDEAQTEPNAGDQLTINVPASGITFKSSFLSGCTITAKASTPTSSSFNDSNSATFTNASIGINLGAGCFGVTGTTASMSGTFTTSTNIGDLTS